MWIGGGPTGMTLIEFGAVDSEFFLLVIVLVPLWWLFRLTFFLLATAVVWPFRALTGRWTVVAYELIDPDEKPVIRRKVKGRKAADALAREWAAIIEREGALDLAPKGIDLLPAGAAELSDHAPSPS
ncbi:hypothetical protein [Actinoplanes sp. CA-252034]|uniref:hypothetical protein n=1 Tax=Actinoplanes sp. CA-252034 TaxID=3239906 RepID=UPI003D971EF8